MDAAKLLMRWFAPRYLGPAEPETTQILLGAVPENLPFDLPLPEGAILIGSFVWPRRESATIVLDVNQPAEAVTEYFRAVLEAQGFGIPESFGGSGPDSDFTLLCQDNDFYVTLSAGDINAEWSEVRLQLVQISADTEYSPCRLPEAPMGSPRTGPLPTLSSPSDSFSRRTEGVERGGLTLWRITHLQTDQSVAELAAHFAPQLEDQGWQEVEESRTDRVVWSLWTLTDQEGRDWDGALMLAVSPELPNGRLTLFRMYRPQRLQCHSSYEPCLPTGIGGFDCTKAEGNFGPNYVEDYVDGPVTVVGPDEFGLDPDGDGQACE